MLILLTTPKPSLAQASSSSVIVLTGADHAEFAREIILMTIEGKLYKIFASWV
jgi:hypothetical protein